MRMRWGTLLAVVLAVGLWGQGTTLAQAPAQRLPSALLIYPLIDSDGGFSRDTRVELLNLSKRPITAWCFYVEGQFCNEFGFFVNLTPNQPLSWYVSQGVVNNLTNTAVPPFSGVGELKCAVLPSEPGLEAHNAIQGRAIVAGADGQTIGYGAVGFERLVDGEFTGRADLDGQTYARCPDEQHFAFLASDTGTESELVLAPCTEDFENQVATTTVVQFLVINEFEQQLSASLSITCHSRRLLRQVSGVFTSPTLGTPTGHMIVRGVQSPVTAMVIDRFTAGTQPATAANEPALRGGRSATIQFP